ncbi:MAG TPA: tetratricopeptide repeat protein [Ktedonobacterales bacterium]|nr:tetratricopeptide repeat protein [Ktedonobacterales bacterium]
MLRNEWQLPAVGKLGVEAWRQTPTDWLTLPARDRLLRWLDNRKTRKLLAQALDEALEALAAALPGDPALRAPGGLFSERFFSNPQVLGTLAACFTSDEPVDYDLLARSVNFSDERLRRRALEGLVAQVRAHLAAASPEFRLQLPVQSAARIKAIQSANQPQQAPPQAAPIPAAAIETTTREKQERAMDHVGMPTSVETSQRLAQAVELENQGRTQEAMALYHSLLRQSPQNGKVHFNLAMLLTEQGRLTEAEEHCRAAIMALPDYPDAWGLHAYLLSLLRRGPESLESARKAVALGFPRKRLLALLKLEPAALA